MTSGDGHSGFRSKSCTAGVRPRARPETHVYHKRGNFIALLVHLQLLLAFLVLLTAPAYASHVNTSQNRPKRIIGGVMAPADRWTFMALVETRDDRGRWNECSATVISPRHVLTAAHCVVANERVLQVHSVLIVIRKEEYRVKLNQLPSNNVNQFRTVHARRVYVHPRYNPFATSDDVAILEIEPPLPRAVTVVPLAADFEENADTPVFVLGFGDYKPEGQDILRSSDHLREFLTFARSFDDCAFHWPVARRNTHLCVGDAGHGIAIGDSGGPAMAPDANGQWLQVGVASFSGNKGPDDRRPPVFMKTSKYCSWMYKVTGGLTECRHFSPVPTLEQEASEMSEVTTKTPKSENMELEAEQPEGPHRSMITPESHNFASTVKVVGALTAAAFLL